MALSREQQFILFALGKCYALLDERFAGRPIQIAVSKSAFIELAENAGFAGKGERALYQNLEDLEKKRLIHYDNKNLSLTKKGGKAFAVINKNLSPYLAVANISYDDLLKFTKKARTVLRWF